MGARARPDGYTRSSMAALIQPPRHIIIGVVAFFLVACFVLFTPRSTSYHTPSSSSSSSAFPSRIDRSSPADVNRVANGTLGFEKIFVVGLPERSDKRDAIALTSTLTGFAVDWVDGVRGESVPDKALPFGADRKKLWETNLGSWRGHMNAIRRYVE